MTIPGPPGPSDENPAPPPPQPAQPSAPYGAPGGPTYPPPAYGSAPPPPSPYGAAPPPPSPYGAPPPPPPYGAPGGSTYPPPAYGQPWQPAPPPPPNQRRNRMIAAAVAVIVLAGVVIGVVLGTSGGNHSANSSAAGSTANLGNSSSAGASGSNGGAVSMTLPSGWVRVPLGASDFRSFLQRATKANPQLGATLSQQMQAVTAQHIRYFAIRQGGASGGFLTNVNVLTEPVASGFDMSSGLGPVKLELSSIGAKQVQARPTRVGSHQAIEATYTLPLNTGAGSVNVEGDQIYEQFPNGIAIITLSALHRSDFAGDLHRMANSLQIG